MTAFSPARASANRLRDLAIIGLILVAIFQHGLPSLPAFAQSGASDAPRAELSNVFTYQGRLVQDGTPANGAFDLEFALYDVASGGVPLATHAVLEDVAVTNGVFAVPLDFGLTQFVGEARWIEVRARAGASAGAFTVVGRQELTATPYAFHAKSAGDLVLPFEKMQVDNVGDGLFSVTAAFQFNKTSTATLGSFNAGVLGFGPVNGVVGQSNDPASSGVYGENGGSGFGVTGRSIEAGGVGVYGTAANIGVLGEGLTYGMKAVGLTGLSQAGLRAEGVVGVSAAGTSIGIDASGSSHGVRGTVTGPGIGIFGSSSSTGIGVKGTSTSGTGVRGEGVIGVSGAGTGNGVEGTSSAGSGGASGVYGENTNGGYGVFGRSLVAGAGSRGVEGEGSAIGVVGRGLANDGLGMLADGKQYGLDARSINVAVIGRGAVIGVQGVGAGDGVRGETTTTNKAGISGIANGGANNNYAAYFVGNVHTEGTITATGMIGPSDARLKTNVTNLQAGLATILRLRPVSFAWLDGHDAGRAHPGFIAQEVRQVLPEVVYEGADDQATLAMSASELVPVLVRAIQELEARVAELEAMVAE